MGKKGLNLQCRGSLSIIAKHKHVEREQFCGEKWDKWNKCRYSILQQKKNNPAYGESIECEEWEAKNFYGFSVAIYILFIFIIIQSIQLNQISCNFVSSYCSVSKTEAYITHSAMRKLKFESESWLCYSTSGQSSPEWLASRTNEDRSSEDWQDLLFVIVQ